MKNDKIKFLLCLLFFVVLALITFRSAWGADRIFSASDVNIGGLTIRKVRGLDLFLGFFSGVPVLGTSDYSVSLFHVLLSLMPVGLFANVFYGLVLVGGSAALIWFLRMWNRSWLASILGGLVGFWFNSVQLASAGHVYKMEVLSLSVLSLCLIEKAVRAGPSGRRVAFAILAGLSVGTMMIEHADVGLLAGLFLGPYAVFRLVQAHGKAVFRWVEILLPITLVSVLLSGSTLLKSYRINIAGAAQVQVEEDDKDRWDYVTQWSMVPGEWPDLIALGWSGWSSGNPDGPYWGKVGQSAEWESTGRGFRNFRLTASYLGVLPFLLGALGLAAAIRARKTEEGVQILFWCVAILLGLWLAFGKYSILYKLFYQLPVVSNIRAPVKFLDNVQICLGIVSAYGLDRLLADGKRGRLAKGFWIAAAACAGMMLVAGLRLVAFPSGQIARFTSMGYEAYAELMVRNMSNAWLHASLLAFLASVLTFFVWKGIGRAKWVATAFVVILAADSLVLTSHYFSSFNIAALKKGNAVTNFIKENQGNERVFFLDQGGMYNQWLGIDRSYHGLNLFNIWQMNRMPKEYERFFDAAGKNHIRLWELTAVKYVAAPASVQEQFAKDANLAELFTPRMSYQMPTAQGMRPDVMLEFNGHVPRFALYHNWTAIPAEQQCSEMFSARHNPQTTVLVDPAAGLAPTSGKGRFDPAPCIVTSSRATASVEVGTPAILRFAQRYEPQWRVYVDGEEADLLKLDYLCMGVSVPEGKHVIEFRCFRATRQVLFLVAVLLLSLVVAGSLLLAGSRRRC